MKIVASIKPYKGELLIVGHKATQITDFNYITNHLLHVFLAEKQRVAKMPKRKEEKSSTVFARLLEEPRTQIGSEMKEEMSDEGIIHKLKIQMGEKMEFGIEEMKNVMGVDEDSKALEKIQKMSEAGLVCNEGMNIWVLL